MADFNAIFIAYYLHLRILAIDRDELLEYAKMHETLEMQAFHIDAKTPFRKKFNNCLVAVLFFVKFLFRPTERTKFLQICYCFFFGVVSALLNRNSHKDLRKKGSCIYKQPSYHIAKE